VKGALQLLSYIWSTSVQLKVHIFDLKTATEKFRVY